MNKATQTQRKQIQRDRATIQVEALTISNPQTSDADKAKALAAISSTVLQGTGIVASGDSGEMLGNLTLDLLKSPAVLVELGITDAIALKVSAADAASIPEKVIQRLKRLV
jgi:hypothetical protein